MMAAGLRSGSTVSRKRIASPSFRPLTKIGRGENRAARAPRKARPPVQHLPPEAWNGKTEWAERAHRRENPRRLPPYPLRPCQAGKNRLSAAVRLRYPAMPRSLQERQDQDQAGPYSPARPRGRRRGPRPKSADRRSRPLPVSRPFRCTHPAKAKLDAAPARKNGKLIDTVTPAFRPAENPDKNYPGVFRRLFDPQIDRHGMSKLGQVGG